MKQTDKHLTGKVIGSAIRVTRSSGLGFWNPSIEAALCLELSLLSLRVEKQSLVPVRYRQAVIGEHRLDLLVQGELVVELKAVQAFEPIHFATLRSYLKATNCSLGLLLNFASTTLEVKRVGREWHSRIG